MERMARHTGYEFAGPVPRELEEALDRVARCEASAATYRAEAAHYEPASSDARVALSKSYAASAVARQTRSELRDNCRDFVRGLKAAGTAPQQVLIAVKTVVRDAARRTESSWDAQSLTAEIVQWAIDAYYGTGL
jgi:hypothetical protein